MTVATNSPSAIPSTVWANPTNAYADGGATPATTSTKDVAQIYKTYAFNLPSTAIVSLVRVRYDAWTAGNEKVKLEVSADDGTSWLAASDTSANLTTSEAT